MASRCSLLNLKLLIIPCQQAEIIRMALEHCYLLPTLMKSVLLFSSFFHICSATDTIRQGKKLNFSETLVSASGDFELGFFSPGQSNNIYLGIWYKRISFHNKTVVWVANREYPLKKRFNSSSFLTINEQGNLLISDGKGMSYSPTSTPPSSKINVSAALLDSGNFILRDGNDVDKVMWQSFDYPSDTLLPGMPLGFNSKTGQTWSLTSWSSMEDPSPGVFSTSIDSSLQLRIMKGGSQIYWREEVSSFLPDRFRYYYNLSYISSETGTYFTYSLYNYVFLISRLSMDLSGQIKMFTWLSDTEEWKMLWSEPSTPCEVYALCGAFSSCDMMKHPYCQCLEGFHPYNLRDWTREDRSAGCLRKTTLECQGKDEFIEMKNVKFPMDAKLLAGLSAEECKLDCLRNCNCNAYAYTNDRGCLTWRAELFGLQENYYNISSFGEPFFLKIVASERNNSGGNTSTYPVKGAGKKLSLILTLPITLTILIFSCLACCLWRRKLKQRGKNKTNQDLLSHDFNAKIEATKSTLSDIDKIVSGKKWDMELPLFSFQSVSACTNNFNDANKLGEGGFGPVFKGKLLNGQEVAIKRLSRGSGQGMEELKNEATLIAKLQHRNLVRLLGCCIEGEEKILIYEYMPNKSLDFFLFVPKNRSVLDWEKRTHIIEGIAQGLLYLHLHSRLRIVHRDLKASNILLDRQMNAKISDFGMARMFGGNESQGSTNRIVGTYGYMSPEYVKEGLFSIKSDVFSFGVLLLEILSGKRNTSFHRSDSLNLIGHAWNLWRSEKGLKLIDPMLRDSSLTSKVLRYINVRDSTLNSIALRYINVALLCVQEQAADRPTMSDVVMMLSNQAMVLPSPNHSGFYAGRSNVENNPSSMKQPTIVSTNNMTVSALDGR